MAEEYMKTEAYKELLVSYIAKAQIRRWESIDNLY